MMPSPGTTTGWVVGILENPPGCRWPASCFLIKRDHRSWWMVSLDVPKIFFGMCHTCVLCWRVLKIRILTAGLPCWMTVTSCNAWKPGFLGIKGFFTVYIIYIDHIHQDCYDILEISSSHLIGKYIILDNNNNLTATSVKWWLVLVNYRGPNFSDSRI